MSQFDSLGINIEVNDYEQINNGRQGDVYRIHNKTGSYILKCPKADTESFGLEHYFLTDLYSEFNPNIRSLFPEVIEASNTDKKYLILEDIPSTPVEWENKEFVLNLIKQLGRTLKQLHTSEIEIEDHYKKKICTSPEVQLKDVKESTISNLEGSYFEEYISDVKSAADSIEPLLPKTPSFMYSDVHIPNLRVNKNGGLNGIIDWETWKFSDPAYELAKAECRIIDLYARFTPYSKQELQTQFRVSYGLPTQEFKLRLEYYKEIYTVRCAEKMKNKSVFQPWKRQTTSIKCWEAYEQLIQDL